MEPQPAESEPSQPSPVSQGERIRSLDVLRGFALLGILVPNIQAFSMVMAAYGNPTVYGDLRGANLAVFVGTHLLFEQKFMTIFSMLFGAGIVLMTKRAERSSRSVWKVYYRRMAWLLVIGLLHAHILWFGDILFGYALCGMVVFWLRGLRPRWLIPIGLIMMSVSSGLMILSGLSMPYWSEEQLAEFRRDWDPTAQQIEAEMAAMRGNWWQQAQIRSPAALMFETFLFAIFVFWRASGLMLIGMALFKLGVITGERAQRFYVWLAAIGFVIALPLIGYEIWKNFSVGWDVTFSFFLGTQINYWAAPWVSLGYMSLIMLMCKNSGFLPWLQSALAAVGRLALTNYLFQSLVGTTIFYGHGLGMFGQLERTEQFMIVLAVWGAQLVLSPIWLNYFHFGPAEWLWRSLTYWKLQPMRLRPSIPQITRSP